MLTQREKIINVDADLVPAAVLIPLFEKDGEYYLLLTKRTEHLRDHKGQISFPGGRYEESDETFLDTALRESAEEIGLSAEDAEILGELDDMPTLHTNYCIRPFLAAISWPLELEIDPFEVDELIEVPVSALMDEDCLKQEDDLVNNGTSEGYFYYYDNRIIWGATARIITQFLEIWSEVTGDSIGNE